MTAPCSVCGVPVSGAGKRTPLCPQHRYQGAQTAIADEMRERQKLLAELARIREASRPKP